MAETPAPLAEQVMNEFEFDLALERFKQTVGAAGSPTWSRRDTVIFLAFGYIDHNEVGSEAKRLLVHYKHLRDGKRVIDTESTTAIERIISDYYKSEAESSRLDVELFFYPDEL